ncbi:WAT1-related protein At5g40210 isoform X2 [Ziziphus jujuba]|uniref:WAT1-related protein At5g40210 isoform X2 n=1 Tax=Ziziphus jujuba TaxID=326968 RepID=A0ABM3ZYV0_ZIZJJ|nr:WAT1-related protein At5g40210 isoform X2 [Ziziphus jujuba]
MKGLGTTVVMVVIECLDVLLHTLTKSAINTGMSEFVYVFCSNALCFFFLLICSFFYYRMWTYLTLTYLVIGKMFLVGLLVIGKMFLVGLLSCTSQILKHVRTDLSCPTLATAISDLTPAFAFIIPIIWRKKDLDLTKKSSQAKSLGTIISIAGALIVTLYGVRLTSASPLPGKFLDQLLFSVQSKWVIAGFILLLQSFFHALTFVVQSSVMREYSEELIATLTDYPAEYPAELFATMREYPAELIATLSAYPAELIATMRKYLAELIATLFCCISMTIISAIVALIAERSNPDAWQIKSNIELIAIGFNAFGKAVHLSAVRKKGPIYRAAFKPLRPVIAFIFGIIFQGETIYLGRVIGGAIASGGVFAVVIWGKAQEDEEDMGKAQEDEEDMGKAQEDEVDEHGQQDPNDNSSSHTLSLLQNQNTAK